MLVRRANENNLHGLYSRSDVRNIRSVLRSHMNVQGQHILIIGSERPWIEALLIAEGAQHVTTLDYNLKLTDHPKVTSIAIGDMSKMVLNGSIAESFDGMISYSSLEHSGLGRYGDQLNPWGDLITMARSWCLLKPGAKALVGMPMDGRDTICFNGYRSYGPVMLAHLFSNWDQVYTTLDGFFDRETDCKMYEYQPLHVLQKPISMS